MNEIQDAVLTAVSELFNINSQDLAEALEQKEVENLSGLISELKPLTKNYLNTKHDEYLNKGYRQASKKTERLVKEIFNNIEFSGSTQDEIFSEIKQAYTTAKETPSKKSKITLQEALQSEEVKSYLDKLKGFESKYNELNTSFETYKNLNLVKSRALNILTSLGANFSSDQNIRQRQEKAFLNELKAHKFQQTEDGQILVLDSDGEKLFNKNAGDYWTFKDLVKTLSPVDFVESKPNNTLPKNNGVNGNISNTYGYTKEQLKSVSFEDYNNALQSGDQEKAQYLYKQMLSNYAPNNE